MDATDDADGRRRLLAAARAEIDERGVEAISLRSIARRAGLSHAAPTYFFGDRAGLLTAVAAEGFRELTAVLRAASGGGPATLVGLGRAYVGFGLAHRELFALMFRPGLLRPGDDGLVAARDEAIGVLSGALVAPAGTPTRPSELTLVSWAFAHGLVTLARDGALQSLAGDADVDRSVALLIDAFGRAVA